MSKYDKYSDGDYQEKVERLVGREVYYCASTLVYELLNASSEYGKIGEYYYEDYLDICTRPDIESAVDIWLDGIDHDQKLEVLDLFGIDEPFIDLTVAISEDGKKFNYQTGDNSFVGNAYGLPHWAVASVGKDTDWLDICDEIINDLLEVSGLDSLDDEVIGDMDDAIDSVVASLACDVLSLIDSEIEDIKKQPGYFDKIYNEFSIDCDEYVEAYEHWIVSDWLADKLLAKGEMVSKDMHGLTIWGRCTTGQSIFLDRVICDIYDDLQEAK